MKISTTFTKLELMNILRQHLCNKYSLPTAHYDIDFEGQLPPMITITMTLKEETVRQPRPGTAVIDEFGVAADKLRSSMRGEE